MSVELVYDMRDVEGLTGAQEVILAELNRRVRTISPTASVRLKPTQANTINSICTKTKKRG